MRTARARPFTGKHEQAEAEHEQARANFGIFRFGVFRARYHRFCEELMEENDTFKNRISGSPEFQISKFFDFRHFEPDITDFVKNL